MLTSDAAHMRNRFGFNARRARSSTGVRCQTARCRKRVAARKNACRRRPCVRAFGDFAKSIAGARGGDGCVRLHEARHRRARCKNNSSHLSVARVSIHFNTASISRGLDSIVLVSAACWRLRLLFLDLGDRAIGRSALDRQAKITILSEKVLGPDCPLLC